MPIHSVVSNIVYFCFINTNYSSSSSSSDPASWNTLLSSLSESSQLIKTLQQEIESYHHEEEGVSSSPSSVTSTEKQKAARHHQRSIMRRVVVAKTLFRSLLQPVVSNLLVTSFRSNAMRIFLNYEEKKEESLEQHLRSHLELLSTTTLPALAKISSIKTKNTLLKLVKSVGDDRLQNRIVCEFMKSAGFEFVKGTDNNNSNGDEYLAEGANWQWSGVPHLQKIIDTLLLSSSNTTSSSSSSSEIIKSSFERIRESLKALKDTESAILTPMEKMLLDRSGLLSADRIAILDLVSTKNNDNNHDADEMEKFIEAELKKINSQQEQQQQTANESSETTGAEESSFDLVSKVLSQKNEARKQAQQKEDAQRFEQAKIQAQKEVAATNRAKTAEIERKQQEVDLHNKKLASVQHLMQKARKTLHATGRLRNSSFEGVEWRLQPLSVATRIHMCSKNKEGCDQENGLEIHWHLRAAPNVIYSFTAHLTPDASTVVHLGEEIGYQYNAVPGMPNFGKTTMVNRKTVDENGKLEKIEANLSKVVSTCVCGEAFDVLWK